MSGPRGFALDFEPSCGQFAPRNTHVIGLVVQNTKGFKPTDVKKIREGIATGHAAHPSAIWVVLDRDKLAQELLSELGVVPLLLPLNPYWKSALYDLRRGARESELLRGCDEVVVFQREGAKTPWSDRAANKMKYGTHSNLYVIECEGPQVKRRATRRTPVAA